MGQKYSQPYCLAKYMKLYIAVCCDIEYGTLAGSFLWAVFHSSEIHYDLGCRDTRFWEIVAGQVWVWVHILIFILFSLSCAYFYYLQNLFLFLQLWHLSEFSSELQSLGRHVIVQKLKGIRNLILSNETVTR